MSNVFCSRCGAPASGNFCSSCGAPLQVQNCPSCGGTPEPGARFCNLCGHALTAAGGAPTAARRGSSRTQAQLPAAAPVGDSKLGWWVAGFALVALIVIIALPIVKQEGSGQPPGGPMAGGGAGAVDLSSMTPREAADRLFDRVMRAESAGDTAQVQMFMPMALAAYDQAGTLDADGLFHLSTLLQTDGQYQEALEVAQKALEDNPDHLLNLGAAADAAAALGDQGTSRAYYARFLELYDQERAKGLEEYESHDSWFEGARERALQATGG